MLTFSQMSLQNKSVSMRRGPHVVVFPSQSRALVCKVQSVSLRVTSVRVSCVLPCGRTITSCFLCLCPLVCVCPLIESVSVSSQTHDLWREVGGGHVSLPAL